MKNLGASLRRGMKNKFLNIIKVVYIYISHILQSDLNSAPASRLRQSYYDT